MKKINKIQTMFFLSMLILFSGCEEEELMSFDGVNSVGFWQHASSVSLYGMDSTELPSQVVELDLAITGEIMSKDRVIEGVAIPDPEGTPGDKRKTTATPGQYRILGGVVKANEQYGKFKIELINVGYLAENELKLNFGLVPNENFASGLKENQTYALTWSRKILQPTTWRAMRFFFCADYSTQVYKVFMQATGLKEFHYYEGQVSVEEAYVMGRNFGNIVRQYKKDTGKPMLHDDGAKVGTEIIPIY